jgi:MFS family permease
MPAYISTLGGEDYKGYIIGVFTIAAAISRPVSGKLADSIGRIPIMVIGGGVCIVVSFLYPLFSVVFPFLVLRFFHGFSTGFMPTGTVAYVADIVSENRRGAAMGLVGIMNNMGFMIGNASSSLITNAVGINGLFYISGILALLSVAVVLRMKETVPEKQPFSAALLKIKKADIWDARAKQPAIIIMLTTTTFGTLLTLIPDYSVGMGIENKGFFMFIVTISTVVTRFLTSSLSDRYGRAYATLVGTSFWLISCILLATLNYHAFLIAAITCGIASGINSPALFAWAVDVAEGRQTGRSLATLFITLEIGIGAGAFGSAAIYANQFENLQHVFAFLGLINVMALVYVIISITKNK